MLTSDQERVDTLIEWSYGKVYGEEEEQLVPGADREIDDLPVEIYCDVLESLESRCGESSPLEIWQYDEERIRSLTQQEILDAFNTVFKSPVTGYPSDYRHMLGGKTHNESGHVVAAKSVRVHLTF